MSQETIKLAPGEFLLHEGDQSTEMYYLISGTLNVIKRKGDKTATIGSIIAGELVGEMSFLDREPRCATVQALSECTLIVIPNENFEENLSKMPKWFRALISTLLDRLRRANVRIKI